MPIRQWKRHMHLEEQEQSLSSTQIPRKRNINLEYIVNMTKPSLRRMSRRQQKRLSQSQEMRVLNIRMESLS